MAHFPGLCQCIRPGRFIGNSNPHHQKRTTRRRQRRRPEEDDLISSRSFPSVRPSVSQSAAVGVDIRIKFTNHHPPTNGTLYPSISSIYPFAHLLIYFYYSAMKMSRIISSCVFFSSSSSSQADIFWESLPVSCIIHFYGADPEGN